LNFNLFIAKRYLFSKREIKFISFINLISVIGIAAGVTALIIVLSILNGFQEITEEKIISFDPHLIINTKIDNPNLIKFLDENSEVLTYSKVKSGDIALLFAKNFSFLKLKSYVDTDDEMMDYFNNSIVIGKESNDQGMPNVILGLGISNSLKIFPGNIIDIYSADMIEYNIRTYRTVKPVKAYVSGIFQSNNLEYDNYLCIGNHLLAEKLYKSTKSQSIEVKVENPYQINKFKEKYNDILKNSTLTSWLDLNSGLLKIMKFEKISTFIILSLIIVIAVFNLLASLSMTVENKLKDIGILKSIGLTNKDIKIIFQYEGLLNGVIGTLIGLAVGLALCYLQINYELIQFDIANVISNTLPISINMADILLIVIASVGLSYLSIIYPADKASKLIISDTFR